MSTLQLFTDVVVSEIPDSYAKSALGLYNAPTPKIDLALARRQHANYVNALRSVGCRVTVLPADERFPDCVFTEDPAVIVGSIALMTQPGHPTRREEVIRMKPVLQALGLVVVEITDPEATLDGGDVQWTGKEILVGISSRTNIKGVQAVAEAFPGYRTIGVPVSGPLHLKTLIGLVGEDTFCVATESGDSIKMYERIRELSHIKYDAIFVPEDNVSNTILINGKVICKSRKENPTSFAILQKYCKHELVEIESSEIEKAIGSLTCLSLRFNRPSSIAPATPSTVQPLIKATNTEPAMNVATVGAPTITTDPILLKAQMKATSAAITNGKAVTNGSTYSSDEER